MRIEDGDTEAPWTDATRARMVMAAEARELSDMARGFVPVVEYELCADGTAMSDGMWVGDATRLVAAAHRVLEAVVVFERLGGTSWRRLADMLDMSKQAVHERFSPAEARFQQELALPENPEYTGTIGEIRYRLHPAARDPDTAAHDLDEWLAQHREPTEPEPDPAPVSGGLARMNPHAELTAISERSHQLWRAHDRVPPVPERLALAERSVTLWEQIAAQQPRSRSARDGLAHARRVADELRAQHHTEPPAGPPTLRLVRQDPDDADQPFQPPPSRVADPPTGADHRPGTTDRPPVPVTDTVAHQEPAPNPAGTQDDTPSDAQDVVAPKARRGRTRAGSRKPAAPALDLDTVRYEKGNDFATTGAWQVRAGDPDTPVHLGHLERTRYPRAGWQARTPDYLPVAGGPWRTRQDALVHLIDHHLRTGTITAAGTT
jgi:uncharacterized protein YoaH (UPF0181 family)